MIGCGAGERNGAAAGEATASAGAPDGSPTESAQADDRAAILFLGTSLTAGLGLPIEQSYPHIVGDSIDARGLPYRIVNAGVSGETSAGALRRIDWILSQPFEVLLLETGANDMLQGGRADLLEDNLQSIIDRVRSARPETTIILAGMRAMPNLGPEYVAEFEAVYPRVADRNGLLLIPFLLDGVAGDPEMNLADGIHPNTDGQRRVAGNVLETLLPVLEEGALRP